MLIAQRSFLESKVSFTYVDVEYRSKLVEEVSRLASEKDAKLILSYHDWRKTPSISVLEKLFSKMRRREAEIYKIVTTLRSPMDEAVILAFISRVKGFKLVCFGMGESSLTRLVSSLIGGFMVYASLDRSLAPGQLNARRMIRIYRRMGIW